LVHVCTRTTTEPLHSVGASPFVRANHVSVIVTFEADSDIEGCFRRPTATENTSLPEIFRSTRAKKARDDARERHQKEASSLYNEPGRTQLYHKEAWSPWPISLPNAKGGCGKTTVALNLAVCFARAGYRTLHRHVRIAEATAMKKGVVESSTTSSATFDFMKLFNELKREMSHEEKRQGTVESIHR